MTEFPYCSNAMRRPPAAAPQETNPPAPPDAARAFRCNRIRRTPTALPHFHLGIWTDDAHPVPSPAQNIPPNTAALPPAASRKSTPPPSEPLRRAESAHQSCCEDIHPLPPILVQGVAPQSRGAGPSHSLPSHAPSPNI